jgi:hypothetical protein
MAHHRDGILQAPPKFDFDRFQLGLHPFPQSLPKHDELPLRGPVAHVQESKKDKALRLTVATPLPIFRRKPSELDQPRLVISQPQVELRKALPKLSPKPLGILPVLESDHEIIGKTHHHCTPSCVPLPPMIDPKVKHIVQVDISQQGTDASSLRHTLLTLRPRPILQYPGIKPLLDMAYDPLIRYPVLDELDQPLVIHGIKGSYDILPTSRVSPPKLLSCAITTLCKGEPCSFSVAHTEKAIYI